MGCWPELVLCFCKFPVQKHGSCEAAFAVIEQLLILYNQWSSNHRQHASFWEVVHSFFGTYRQDMWATNTNIALNSPTVPPLECVLREERARWDELSLRSRESARCIARSGTWWVRSYSALALRRWDESNTSNTWWGGLGVSTTANSQ